MTDRRTLREAFKRLSTNQRVTPVELHRTVENVVALCRRDTHFAWLRHAAEERAKATQASDKWSRQSYAYSARNALDYARQTRTVWLHG
jgi:hypothetical protein